MFVFGGVFVCLFGENLGRGWKIKADGNSVLIKCYVMCSSHTHQGMFRSLASSVKSRMEFLKMAVLAYLLFGLFFP